MKTEKVIRKIFELYLIIFFVTTPNTFSQKISFQRLSTENGLSNNLIYDIIQDKYGFLWIATDDGLNRYDGYEFKIFRNNPSDSNSLSDNSVWSLAEDNAGRLWIGTKSGWLNCYDPIKEKFFRYFIPSEITKENTITAIFVDDENKVWIATYRSGLYLFIPAAGELKNWKSNPFDSTTLSYNYVSSLVADKAGNLWIGTYNGLCRFNYKI
jgi:ligand-binding sensor domain-containing protein